MSVIYSDSDRTKVWSSMKQEYFLYEDLAKILSQSDHSLEPEYIAYLIRGIVLGKLGRYEEAVDSYKQAIEFDLTNPDILYYQGLAFVALGQRQEAIAAFEQSLKMKPDYYAVWREQAFLLFTLGHLEQAVEAWDKALGIKQDDPRSWYKRGVALSCLNRPEESIDSYTKALELSADYRQAQRNRDLLLRNLKIIEFQLEDHTTWLNRGIELCDTKAYEDALECCRIALKLKEDYPEAWYYQGLSLCKLGRYQEAVDSCEQALNIKPDHQESWHRRGISLMKMGNYEEAVTSFDKALSLKPNFYDILHDRGISLSMLGRYDEAMASYDCALEIQPNSYVILYDRGVLLSTLGREEEAISNYNQAISINPDFYGAWKNLGLSYYHLGKYKEALDSFDRALEINPNDKALQKYRYSALHKFEQTEKLFNIETNRLEMYAELIKEILAVSNEEEIKHILIIKHRLIDTNFLFTLKQAVRIYSDRGNEDAVQRLSQLRPIMGKTLQELALEDSNTASAKTSDREPSDLDAVNLENDPIYNPYLRLIEEDQKRQTQEEGRTQFVFLLFVFIGIILAVLLGRKLLFFFGIAVSLISLGVLCLLYFLVWDISHRGLNLHDQGKYQEALSFYAMVLIFFRRFPQAWFQRGRALYQLERYEEALASYDQVLRFQPKNSGAWHNRGLVLHSIGRLEEAINSYDRSLEIEPNPTGFHNRGNDLVDLRRYEEAIASFDEGLNIEHTVSTWYSRGIVFLMIEKYEEATRNFEVALILHSRNLTALIDPLSEKLPSDIAVLPSDLRFAVAHVRYNKINAMREFAQGRIEHLQGNINQAIGHYYQSKFYADTSYEKEPRENLRDKLFEGRLVPSFFLVDALVEADRHQDALQIAEETKGRKLKEQFKDFTDNPFRSFSPQGGDPHLANYARVSNALMGFLNKMYNLPYENESTYQTVISLQEIRELLPSSKTVLIEWYVTDLAIHAFVIAKNPYTNQLVKVFSIDQLKRQQLLDLFTDYNIGYAELRESRFKGKDLNLNEKRWDKQLSLQLQQMSDLLGINDIIGYIRLAAPSCDSLIFVPHSFIHLLPLHALPVGFGENILLDLFPCGIRYFPSCSLLKLLQERNHRWSIYYEVTHGSNSSEDKAFGSLLAFQNPTSSYSEFPDLLYSYLEVSVIKNFFKDPLIYANSEATKEKLHKSLHFIPRNCIHLSCHGFFNYQNPSKSSLILAGKQFLNLADITRHTLEDCHLVVLSACESGLTDVTKLTDEYVGLPCGFLVAGAKVVVSSLWLVDDLPTALLMIRFYEILASSPSTNAQSASIALNQAQQWLRGSTTANLIEWVKLLPIEAALKRWLRRKLAQRCALNKVPFSNPYYWAAFCAIGQ
jgi:tetratricopeptide (TPR) repeat protein/CHAT domain-containing protein